MIISNSVFIQLLFFFACVSIAYLLYRQYGLRKVLPASLILILSIAAYILLSIPPKAPPELTPEIKQQIRAEQMLVADWYTLYKQDITQVDLYWQQYHKNLAAFMNDEISIQILSSRLAELEAKLLPYKDKYATAALPDKLRPDTAETVTKVLHKTRSFIDSEHQVIKKSAVLAAAIPFQQKPHQDQLHDLEKIMILDGPSLLNIAAEINDLRDTLVVPGETE